MSQITEVASSAKAEDPVRREVFGEPLLRLAVISCTLLLIAIGLVAMVVHRAPAISPFDEATHADYAYQISHGQVPAKGSIIAPEILKEWSCHGAWDFARLPSCGSSRFDASKYPGLGQDYNFVHPPLYYAVTGVIARAADATLSGTSHFITLARLVGALWLFAAMFVLYLGLRRLGATWQLSTAAAVLLPLCPQVLFSSATVNNDVAAALSGSLAVLVLARIMMQRKMGWIVPTVVTGLCAATKLLNALPMLSLAGMLFIAAVVAWRKGHREEARKLALIVLGVLAAATIVYGGWIAIQSGRGLVGWKSPIQGVNSRPVVGNPIGAIFGDSFSGFQMISNFWVEVQLRTIGLTLWARLLSFLAAAAPLLLIALTRKREAAQWLAGAALLGMICYPIIVQMQTYIGSGTTFPIVSPRYGMSITPLLIACLILAAQRRGMPRSLLTVVGAGVVVTVVTVTGLL